MRILMLGNSLTYSNDMPSMLAGMLDAEVVHHTRGGARLSEHLNPRTRNGARTRAALEKESWDYVVLQEMSSGPVVSRRAFLDSVGRLCAMIREKGARPLLFATWPYQSGSRYLEDLGLSREEMEESLYEAYHTAAGETGALIADVGRRFMDLSKIRNLYAEDGKHPSERGSRLAAETIAEVIRKDRGGMAESEPGRNDTRLRVLYMYRILLKHSDADHQLTTNQIRALMEKEHGISMHRTTVPGDIEILRAAGFDVHARRSRQNRYYLENAQFELPELKILIDAVESSRFITERKCRDLVEKLLTLTSDRNAEKLKRNLHTAGRVRSDNEKGYYIVDSLNAAINAGKRISFFYTDYNARKKQVLRNDGKPYVVSPYTLIWNGDYYYMVGWDHDKAEIRTYRVDRILQAPEILKEDACPIPRDFDVTRYTREVFRMYDNQETKEVTLLCGNDVMKGLIDVFGTNIRVRKADKDHFRTKVRVCTSPTFYGWVFQWGGKVRIESPQEAAEAYREMARKVLDRETAPEDT